MDSPGRVRADCARAGDAITSRWCSNGGTGSDVNSICSRNCLRVVHSVWSRFSKICCHKRVPTQRARDGWIPCQVVPCVCVGHRVVRAASLDFEGLAVWRQCYTACLRIASASIRRVKPLRKMLTPAKIPTAHRELTGQRRQIMKPSRIATTL